MKKRLLLLLIPLTLSGCIFKTEERAINLQKEINVEEKEYIDNNPIKLGIFLADNNYNNKNVIENTYYANFTSGEDISSFEVLFTDDKVINGGNYKNIWNKYYSKYNNIDDYKIGYNIKFTLKNGKIYEGNFLEPDIFKFADYFYVYLYDDINQEENTFYSHLEEVNKDTMITSIKLYAVSGIDKVDNITLSAFTYDNEEDFDEKGNYRGNSKYTITIKKQ